MKRTWLVAVFICGFALVGCSKPPPPINYNDPALILAGDTADGRMQIMKVDDTTVKAVFDWFNGGGTLHRGDEGLLSGTLAGQDVRLRLQPEGALTCSEPSSARVQLTVQAASVGGTILGGTYKLVLAGDRLTGKMPWGDFELRLGARYRTLSDPMVEVAIAAVTMYSVFYYQAMDD